MIVKRTMRDLELATLAILRKHSTPIRCGLLGDLVFLDNIRNRNRHNGSAPFARIQGKIMKRLEKRGLVKNVWRYDGVYGWVLTEKGKTSD